VYKVEVLMIGSWGSFWHLEGRYILRKRAVMEAMRLALDHTGGNVRIVGPGGHIAKVSELPEMDVR
jgi:hypothetical protein